MLRITFSLLCLMCLLSTHCGRYTPGGTVQRTTVGDTLIVTSTPPAEPGESLFLFERDLVIGVGEGESPEDPFMFSYISDLAVDEDGQIYALEYGDREVRVFDRDGAFLFRFGRSGQGPGEFHSGADGVQPVSILHDGRIVVEDYYFSLEVFGPDGNYQTSIDINALNMKIREPGRAFFPIRWLSPHGRMLIPWRDSNLQEGTILKFLITDESFESTLWLPGSISSKAWYSEGSTSISLPFVGSAAWALTGDGILVWGNTGDYKLTYYDIVRDRWLQAVMNIEPEPVTSEDIRKYKDQRFSRLPDSRRAVLEPIYNRAPYPKYKPVFSSLTGDDEGRVWVARDVETYILGIPEAYRYDLFNDQGEWLGIVDSPKQWEIILNGYAYTTASQEEFPVIVRYCITSNR